MVARADREKVLNQHSCVVWLTGLSGSGKSTLAMALERKLFELGYFAQMLDGDNIRSGINSNLGFSLEDREENIRRISEVAKLFCHAGVIAICSFVSPTIAFRSQAKTIIGDEDFVEVFVNASLEACESRDVKGLYAKARRGEIKNFTGIDSPYEAPVHPDLQLDTDDMSESEALEILLAKVLEKVKV